jgi:hypothetical protein|nr:MAG TPA: Protein of unknown function (DUF1653) [Bacteriophage sp.]
MKLIYKRDYPQPGEKWKHFKGHVYKILFIAGDAEHEGLAVAYQSEEVPKLKWVRSLKMFMSEVDHEKYPDVTRKWRFEKVGDANE